jgi:nucleolar protein 58
LFYRIKLKYFHKFKDVTEALAANIAALEGSVFKSLKKTLKNCCSDIHEELAVADVKLGNAIKKKLEIPCVYNTAIQELIRCIRSQAENLVTDVSSKEMTAMALGLAHSLSRYKLKFSSEKVDIMVVQAICLLDELDKQLNNYIMKAREWYGWHFPELNKILKDNIKYIKTMLVLGQRENSAKCDLSDIMDEETEIQVKEAAQTSMGSEISEFDAMHMQYLCVEIIDLNNYRTYLSTYLTNRMTALSPNLTVLVGDLVGARLIAKAGTLTNLAKHPASTLQILGAEKALFRALKSRKKTPKYGLIYHAQLVGRSSNKNKGKISRMLAAKAALAARIDALTESNSDLYNSSEFGIEHKARLEQRLRMLEEGNQRRISGTAKAKAKFEKYYSNNENKQYGTSADSTLPNKRPLEIEESDNMQKKKKKKHNTDIEQTEIEVKEEVKETEMPKKKKKRTIENEELGESSGTQELQVKVQAETESVLKKKKKKHSLNIEPENVGESSNAQEESQVKTEEKKKKKKKRTLETAEMTNVEEISQQAQLETDIIPKKKKKKKQESDEIKESVNIENVILKDASCEIESTETNESKYI